jgi:hypothetical protein
LANIKNKVSLRQIYVGYFFGSHWDPDLDESINSIAVKENLTLADASFYAFVDIQKKLFKRVNDVNYTDKFFSEYYCMDICTSTIRVSHYRLDKEYFPMLLLEYDLMLNNEKKEFFKGKTGGFNNFGKKLSEVLGYDLLHWKRMSKKEAKVYL